MLDAPANISNDESLRIAPNKPAELWEHGKCVDNNSMAKSGKFGIW